MLKIEGSSNVDAVGYDKDSQTLRIQFKAKGEKSPSAYDYSKVPREIYQALNRAESLGGFIHKSIVSEYQAEKLDMSKLPKEATAETCIVCSCGYPLLFTMAFPGFEYYCLKCGAKYGMAGVDQIVNTPELIAELKKAEEFFNAVRGKIFFPGTRVTECDKCRKNDEDHVVHMSKEESKAHMNALIKLKEYREKEVDGQN
jgi:hypothetical protein